METEDKVLDNETRKKLAETGMLGFTDNPEFIYVPEAFRKKDDSGEYKIPKEHWPMFMLKAKDGIESAKMEDGMGYMEYESGSSKSRWISKSGSRRIVILREGIKGWKNWYDTEGKEIPFRNNNGAIHNDSLKKLPVPLAIELTNAITDHISLTPEELEGLEF